MTMINSSLDQTILIHLVYSDSYAKKVLPFLKREYFHDATERLVYEQVDAFYEKYKARPTVEALRLEVDILKNIPEQVYGNLLKFLSNLKEPERPPDQWLIDSTERFCTDKAIYNAIMDGIGILQGDDKEKRDKHALPKILSDALAVSFDTNIGHDFLENADDRWEQYHRVEERIPFDLEMMNKVTRGGWPKKTLNIFMAGTGVGKTLTMCHCAAANLNDGKQVLYITLEMAESEIAKRIDANLMGVDISTLETMPKPLYDKKIEAIRAKTHGKLIIKEYPTASAHAGHFRHLMNELNLKRNFKPDVVYIDYINICLSSRYKMSNSNVNSYTYIKGIAEELRGLAVEKNVPFATATQSNRGGFVNTDPGMQDTAESFGLPQTVDWMVVLVSSEELDAVDQIMVKQLKSRYNDINKDRRFVLGINKSKMKLFDINQSAAIFPTESVDAGPAFDKTNLGQRILNDEASRWKITKGKDFSGLKTS